MFQQADLHLTGVGKSAIKQQKQLLAKDQIKLNKPVLKLIVLTFKLQYLQLKKPLRLKILQVMKLKKFRNKALLEKGMVGRCISELYRCL